MSAFTINNNSSTIAEMGDRGHNKHGPKEGAAVPLSQGGAGSPSNTMRPGLRSTSVPSGIFTHPAVWPQQTCDEGLRPPPPFGEGAGSPSNTMSLGPRPTSLPSGILIHPAIWQQQTWAENWGSGCAPLGEGELGRHLTQYGQGRAYLHAKFHLDPSNCLATIHQCHRQDRQTEREDRTMVR